MVKFLPVILVALVMFSGFVWSSTEGDTARPIPTNNKNYYAGGEFKSEFYGHVGAVSGEVIQREPGPEGRPLLLLKLDEVEQSVWLASVKKADESLLDVGDRLMVLGFFDRSELETQYVQKLSQSPEYLLSFCIYKPEARLPVYAHEYLDKCLEWERGSMPQLAPHSSK